MGCGAKRWKLPEEHRKAPGRLVLPLSAFCKDVVMRRVAKERQPPGVTMWTLAAFTSNSSVPFFSLAAFRSGYHLPHFTRSITDRTLLPHSHFLGRLPQDPATIVLWAGTIRPSEAQEEALKASLRIRGWEGGRRRGLCATGGQAAFVPRRLVSWMNGKAELPTVPTPMSLPTLALVNSNQRLFPKDTQEADFICSQERDRNARDLARWSAASKDNEFLSIRSVQKRLTACWAF